MLHWPILVSIYSPLYCVLDRLYPWYLDSLHEFDQTTRDLHNPWPNRRGGMSRHPAPAIGLKVEAAIASAEIDAELVCPWVHPTFHQERTVTITRGTTSLKEWANVWSPDKKPKLNSMSIMKHKDHMMKFTQMAPTWMRGGSGGHQPPFPGWWDYLAPTV